MTLKVIPLLQDFSSVMFRIYGASRGPSTSADFINGLKSCLSRKHDEIDELWQKLAYKWLQIINTTTSITCTVTTV